MKHKLSNSIVTQLGRTIVKVAPLCRPVITVVDFVVNNQYLLFYAIVVLNQKLATFRL